MKVILAQLFRVVAPFFMRGLGLGRLPMVSRLFSRLLDFLKQGGELVKVGHFKMRLDPYDSLSLSVYGVYEPFTTRLVKENLTPYGLAVDIGAHIGYYTLIMSRAVGKSGEVLAFEPNPVNFKLLNDNIELNHCHNVSAHCLLIGDKKKMTTLYLDSENSGGHSLVPEKKRKKSGLTRVMLPLDDIIETSSIDLIKIDVQGAEWLVLQGMKRVIAQSPGLKIFLEFAPHALKRLGASPLRVLEFLHNSGFVIYEVSDQKKKLVSINNEKVYLKSRAKERGFEVNLYCFKEF